MSAASAGLLGARPEGQLVEFFIERCNERLVEYIDSNAFREAPDDSKLFSCIKTRLKMNAPHVASGTWAQAMAIMARPENVSTLLRQQHGMVSEIARATRTEPASNASDLAYKAMIAAAYGVAEVSMLSDKSDGFHDTWRTLERELALWERRGSRR
ncbi:unnamed protein product [Pedinophyceae sp. YPF-701]|nr:unnamed protein product [Pedinophyceae sp. YPF-701]